MGNRMIAVSMVLSLVISLFTLVMAAPAAITVADATVSAYVTQLNGNTNDLHITIKSIYGEFSKTFNIRNNAEDTYILGGANIEEPEFTVYVDTKGNTQIRACYFTQFRPAKVVKLVEGSLGTPAANAILGLDLGMYYTVSVGVTNPTTMYVAKDGSLTADPAGLALLSASGITGLINGVTYSVSGSVSYPLTSGFFTAEILQQIEAICNRNLYASFTSMVVSVVKNGQIQYFNFGTSQSSRDAGYADPASRTPVDEHSVYEIASLSKPFASLLLAYFDQQGWLKMTDPISKYFNIPDFIDADGTHVAPTLEDLGAHTSGLTRMPRNWEPNGIDRDPQAPYEFYTRARMEAELANVIYDYKPGTVNSYSNFGVGVLGNVLADVYYRLTGDQRYNASVEGYLNSGRAYNNLLIDLLGAPLGLLSTKVISDDSMLARKTLPHNSQGVPSTEWHFDAMAGCGGIKSTSRDLALLMALHCGDYMSDHPLYAAVAEIIKPRTNLDNMGRSFNALGWMVQPNRPSRLPAPALTPTGVRYGELLYHSGAVNGYSTMYMCVPEANAGVVCMLNNSDQSGLADGLCAEILDVVLSSPTKGSQDNLVKLAPGSLGVAGDRCITNLTPGLYYMLSVTTPGTYKNITTYLYTNAAGIITDNPTAAAPLSGTVITHATPTGGIRLLNGQTYLVTASTEPPPSFKVFEDEVYRLAATTYRASNIAGMSLGYFSPYTQGTMSFGYNETDADNVGTKTEITDSTLFELGGAANTFTATLYQLLLQRGILQESWTLGTFYPDAAKYNGSVWPTLRQMATNTSGLPGWPASFNSIGPANYSLHDLEQDLVNLTYPRAPGTPAYSDLSMGLLTMIMTTAYNDYAGTDFSYNQLLQELLFQPLGMTSTAVRGAGLSNPVALPHTRNGGPASYYDFGFLGAPIEVYSTSADMGIWFAALTNAIKNPQSSGTILGAMRETQSYSGNSLFRLGDNGTYRWVNYWSNGFNMSFVLHFASGAGCVILGNFYDDNYTFDPLANRIATSALSPVNMNWV